MHVAVPPGMHVAVPPDMHLIHTPHKRHGSRLHACLFFLAPILIKFLLFFLAGCLHFLWYLLQLT
jgi:hypothetical protein